MFALKMSPFFRSSKKEGSVKTLQILAFTVEVTFKPIKNMYLKISARDLKIRVSAPAHASEKEVRRFVENRAEWLEIRLKKYKQRPVNPEINYVTGDQVIVWGEPIELCVIKGGNSTKAYKHINIMMVNVRGKSTLEKRKKAIQNFYGVELKSEIKQMIEKWEPIMGVKVAEFGVKKMKTRWGTCNIRDHRIWLNLKLAEFDKRALEMVVVHEMVHLLERNHNKRFYAYMDQFLPEWKTASKLLDGRVC